MSELKRKREDARPSAKERRLRQRQEEMEHEFAAAYHGPTALYKLLEVRHLRSPLFLPRALSYRRVTRHDERGALETPAKKKKKPTSDADEPVGATLREFKIGMTAETIEQFKRDGTRVGLLFAVYTASGRKFADNSFDLLATCLIPVPCAKEAKLPKQFARPRADLAVVTVQVVRINDVIEKLTAETKYSFATPAATVDVKPVLGTDLLKKHVGAREPLYSDLLRVDGNQRRVGTISMELPAVSAKVRGVVKLQFRLVWEKPSKQSKIDRLQKIVESKWKIEANGEISSELTVPKRIKPSPYTRRGASHVWYHYLYHSMLRRMTEKRPDFSCAWCNLYAGSLKGLVSHLVSSHSRFRFHVTAGNDNVPHIYVMPRSSRGSSELSIPSVNPSLCELNLEDDKDSDKAELHYSYISPRKRGIVDADAEDPMYDRFHELEEVEEEQPQEFYAPLLQRQYFHSRTGAVVLDHEKDYDSDDDVDEEWITQQSERLLDEFEDVSLEEKEFMKKWNRHVKENRILADFMVASSCRLFAKRHGKWLVESGLRFNFLLHLFNLWDNSLLNSRAIIDCMLIVDHYAVMHEMKEAEANETAKGAQTNGVTPAKVAAPSS